MDFYCESGMLVFGVEDDFIQNTRAIAAKMGTTLQELKPSHIQAHYPWMGVPACTQIGLLQTQQAGHLSPRKLTAAQLTLATRQGVTYIDAEVQRVIRSVDDTNNDDAAGRFVITTSDGNKILANNVLVAAGCYTSLLSVLPEKVVVSLTGSQAALVEVTADVAATLSGMPSMIFEGKEEEDCVYLLPPIKYPDGKWLIKIGPSTAFAPPLSTVDDVDAWFRRGALDPAFETKARATFGQLFPGIEAVSWRPLLCVTDNTPKQNAYIDILAPGWGICTGGNGWAAKSSDEIGLLAAQMMALPQHWGPDLRVPLQLQKINK